MKPTLYLMFGYPGAGKTTVAHIISKLTGAVRLSSDEIRLEMFPRPTFSEQEHGELYSEIDRRTEELLKQGKDVIYDANLNRLVHRQEKYTICERVGAQAKLIWVQTPEEIARTRATLESDGDPKRPYGNLEAPVFSRLVDQIEPPKSDEPHSTIKGVNVTDDIVKQTLGL